LQLSDLSPFWSLFLCQDGSMTLALQTVTKSKISVKILEEKTVNDDIPILNGKFKPWE
jgi:chorismate-pyruvate lyase